MKCLYFTLSGDPRFYWRCAVCREHHQQSVAGVQINVGLVCEGLVCPGQCTAVLRRGLQKLIPDAVPEITSNGELQR